MGKTIAKAMAVDARAVDARAMDAYFRERLGPEWRALSVEPLGSGVHGQGYRVRARAPGGDEVSYVLKGIAPSGLGHDYPADRAAMHILARDTFNELDHHVLALDVLALSPDGRVRSVPEGADYYLLMEHAEGEPYFTDLAAMATKVHMDDDDMAKLSRMAAFLARLHSRRPSPREAPDPRQLYLRKLRDTIGHGECLMGVFDTYPEGAVPEDEITAIESLAIAHKAMLRDRHARLCAVHGDFHPGNIWWKRDPQGRLRMVLLDRSRGPWGDAADDVSALTVNYIFFSLLRHGRLAGAYHEALLAFFDEYALMTGDGGLGEALPLFFAFRGAVVANPVFYPDVTAPQRAALLRFVRRVLEARRFDPAMAQGYLE